MSDAQIFKATYSGVPVYELMCKGVAVMRRRADGWLNATQILKVAGLDKPQRTRVLERDVQKGKHEKVQGGYGKYQGTWIPLERGLEIAKQFNCEDALRPIIEYQPDSTSPPLAPKHLIGPIPGRPARRTVDAAANQASARASRRAAPPREPVRSDDDLSLRGSDDRTMSPVPSDVDSTSPTPSPIQETRNGYDSAGSENYLEDRKLSRLIDSDAETESDEEPIVNPNHPPNFCDEVLEYFISDTQQIPKFLISPPPEFDPNILIDDDGHCPLHWAAAMGRIRVVKLLLTAGADLFKTNKAGQTALMRSVMFANNYDIRKFPELYELLHKCTLNIDHFNRTVFHHIVDVAMAKGKTHAARYYMETILNRLSEYGRELADILNFQDEDGETALTLAARCRSKRLVKLLIDHGADPKVRNKDGKNTEDYILEDERFRSSPILPSRTLNAQRMLQPTYPPYGTQNHYSYNPPPNEKVPLHYSVAAQVASTRCINDMTIMLNSLAKSFDQELKDKERDMIQAHALLGSIQTEILESQRIVLQLRHQSRDLDAETVKVSGLEYALALKMALRHRKGSVLYHQESETQERSVRATSIGQSLLPRLPPGDPREPNGSEPNVGNEIAKEIQVLFSKLPADAEAMIHECDALRFDLAFGTDLRKETMGRILKQYSDAGTGIRMNNYRRLIGAGCGGLTSAEVDEGLPVLLETLESEESNVTPISWMNIAHQRAMAMSG